MNDDNEFSAALDRLGGLDIAPEIVAQVRVWHGEERYASERAALEQLVQAATGGDADACAELTDAFGGPLAIGTGGRRGKVGPGPNRINAVVLRETARGLVRALAEPEFGAGSSGDRPKRAPPRSHRVAIAFDTRTDSGAFARLVAAQLAADGCAVELFGAPRPTPQLSFFMRQTQCSAGIVISASHNPPEDNGIKLYGPDGAQVLGAAADVLMQRIVGAADEDLGDIDLHHASITEFDPATDPRGDGPYHVFVRAQGVPSAGAASPSLRVVFTPLHGVGHYAVTPVLRAAGFDVDEVARQCDPDGGRFSTVKSANPEVAESMKMACDQATESGADLVLACDPDADRLGACVRDADGAWQAIGGNRLAVLMLDHVLTQSPSAEPSGWVLTTVVSSPLIAALARARGIEVVDDLLVGFKHHAGMVREAPERPVVFACEESHGYVRGNEIRDKDGAIAALLLSQAAVVAKNRERSLWDRLDEIWLDHGYHREKTENLWAHGSAGREAIAAVMQEFRERPPSSIGGLEVRAVQDRSQPGESTGSATRDLLGNVLILELTAGHLGCRLVLRPSGTEPKLKLYGLVRAAPGPDTIEALTAVKSEVDALADQVLADARSKAEVIMAPFIGTGVQAPNEGENRSP